MLGMRSTYSRRYLAKRFGTRCNSNVPVDFFPLILGLLASMGMVAGFLWIKKSRRRLRAAFTSLMLFIAPWAIIYTWMYDRAEIRYGPSAAKGNAEAQYRLGFAHMFYYAGASYDPLEGDALLQRAADAGNSRAQTTLACFVLFGLEEAPDENRALALLDRAAPSIPDAAILATEVRAHHVTLGLPSGVAGTIIEHWTSTRQ
jgi:TPR repeat protein